MSSIRKRFFLSLDLQRVLPALPAGLATLSTEARRRWSPRRGGGRRLGRGGQERDQGDLLIGNFWRPPGASGAADAKLGAARRRSTPWPMRGCSRPMQTIRRCMSSTSTTKWPRPVAGGERSAHALSGQARLVGGGVARPGRLLSADLGAAWCCRRRSASCWISTTRSGAVSWARRGRQDGIRIAEAIRWARRSAPSAGDQGRAGPRPAARRLHKNNQADVEEAFRLRPEMPLGLEDFAAVRINWEPKHTNLRDRGRAEHRHGQPGLRRRQPGRVRAGAADAARGHDRSAAARSVDLCRAAARHARAGAPRDRGRGPAQDRAVSGAGGTRGQP